MMTTLILCAVGLGAFAAWLGLTHTFTFTWSNGSGSALPAAGGPQSVSTTGTSELNNDLVLTAGATNQHYTYALPIAALQSTYFVSTIACTVKTNSSGSPQETLTLAAGVPTVWVTGEAESKPFAGALTDLYITNVSATNGTLSIRNCYNA